ncbi:TetR/AcrR family transcriptional regulator [Streptomyces sp. P38-E01]|uniref:TetR/AcrR family transcriptional regulator n=1 Tax=Streptomyces tardus TaxID=2780544 RepID=A0A949JPR1_9ACTN|nr:TetR/AcrR family transcriptional regulator [Streptomyces tardus]MBU7598000.1 TetR/AcrR family transcriptional regulator [Streptomyces tardus]
MARKQRRGEETAERLLDAALAVYTSVGQPGFTVQAVADRSGVSLGSLYHHFGSFDGLAAALYTRCMEQLCGETNAALLRTRTTRTGTRAFVESYLRFTEEHPDVALFIHASSHSSYLSTHAEQIRAAKEPMRQALAEWLGPRMAAGEIAPMPPEVIEVLVVGPLAETAGRWFSEFYDIDLRTAARVLPDRIWRSLRPD